MRRDPTFDDITRAVLAREEVVAYVNGSHGESGPRAEERIHEYLEELRTRQRYPIYRALKHPLYPILRKITRITENEAIVRQSTAQGRVVLRLEPSQPHRLPDRALGTRGQRYSAAGDRRGHQPVRRPARPDSPARDRRDSDPAQRKGPGLPDHAQGLRCRDPRPPRPDVLHRGRAQLQRRDEVAEDRPRPRRAAGGAIGSHFSAVRRVLRSRARRLHPCASESETRPAPVHAGARRDGAIRGRLPIPDLRHVRHANRSPRLRPARASRRAGAGASPSRHHRTADEGAADAHRRARDAADRFDAPSSKRASARSWSCCRLPARTWRSTDPKAVVDDAIRRFDRRGIVVIDGDRFRVRERNVLRYYARTIEHLLPVPPSKAH